MEPTPAADESLGPPVEAAPAGRMTRRVVLVTIVIALGAGVFWLTGPGRDPERVWAEAQRALQEQRIDDAARLADRLARLREPKDVDWMLRAQVAAAQGRPDEALLAIRRVPETSPLVPQAELFAGRIELRRHRFRDAEAHFRLALEIEPGLAEARRELIYILGFQLRRGELDEHFRALAKTGGLDFDQLLLWCLARGIQWKPEEIVDRLEPVVHVDHGDVDARLAIAESLLELNRRDEAAAMIADLPLSDPDVRAGKARLALEGGDLATMAELLAEGPAEHDKLALMRGKLAMLRGDPAAAIEPFRIAARLRPTDEDALSGLVQALNRAGRPDEAAAATERLERQNVLNTLLKNAKHADRTDPDYLLALGDAAEAVGLRDQALGFDRLAIAADPLDTRAQRAVARLTAAVEEATDPGTAEGE